MWLVLNICLRSRWADYFDRQNIQYAFFSAAKAVALQQARQDKEACGNENGLSDSDIQDVDEHDIDEDSNDSDDSSDDMYFGTTDVIEGNSDPRAKVLSVLELESLFVHAAPELSSMC